MDESENRKHGVGFWCCWAVSILMLYVAGIGPAAWMFWRFPAAQPVLNAVYYPIRIPAEAIRESRYASLVGPLDTYVEWWENLPKDPL